MTPGSGRSRQSALPAGRASTAQIRPSTSSGPAALRKGLICHAAVFGDFFSSLDAETICGVLEGCRYEREAVLRALLDHGIDGAIYQISAKEMAAAIAD